MKQQVYSNSHVGSILTTENQELVHVDTDCAQQFSVFYPRCSDAWSFLWSFLWLFHLATKVQKIICIALQMGSSGPWFQDSYSTCAPHSGKATPEISRGELDWMWIPKSSDPNFRRNLEQIMIPFKTGGFWVSFEAIAFWDTAQYVSTA